jgi:hypothetical protein
VIAKLYYTLGLSYDEHSTALSASNPPKPSGPVVWDAAAIKVDCSLPAMSRKQCKRYKMDIKVSNNDPGPARARAIVKNQPSQTYLRKFCSTPEY